jgi:hypothetical protein
MRRLLIAALAAAAAMPTLAADVGVSISVGQPGFYGRLDIGDFPPPALVYPQPVVIEPVPPGVVQEPMYLRVPPGHAKNWRRYCNRYHACGHPVYFVQDRWYHDTYVPRYRERHDERYRHEGRRYEGRPAEDRGNRGEGHGRGEGRDRGEGHDRGHRHDDR